MSNRTHIIIIIKYTHEDNCDDDITDTDDAATDTKDVATDEASASDKLREIPCRGRCTEPGGHCGRTPARTENSSAKAKKLEIVIVLLNVSGFRVIVKVIITLGLTVHNKDKNVYTLLSIYSKYVLLKHRYSFVARRPVSHLYKNG